MEKIVSNANIKKEVIIIIILLAITICIAGFLLGRTINRKNKLTAKELEENFNSSLYDQNDMSNNN